MMTELKQRSTKWRRLRRGDVTASRFGDVLARPSASAVFTIKGKRGEYYVVGNDGASLTGNFGTKADAEERRRELVAEWQNTHWSATAWKYLCDNVWELLTGEPSDTFKTAATDWGRINEPHAFEMAGPVIEKWFGQTLALPENEYAYIHHPTEKYIGCSPDGIIGDKGVCEIKCPIDGGKWLLAKFAYADGTWTVPNENIAQVQGQLWVTGRKWTAFCYFDPRVARSGVDPLLVIRVERDDEYIDNVLAPRVCAFRDELRARYLSLVDTKDIF